jgi:hypothetical protein
MADRESDLIRAVRTEAYVAALDVGLACLDIVEAESPEAVGELQNVRELLDRLEVLIVSLVRNASFAWNDIAQQCGVERQSIHYRLSRKVDAALNETKNNVEQPEYRRSLLAQYHGGAERLAHKITDLPSV